MTKTLTLKFIQKKYEDRKRAYGRNPRCQYCGFHSSTRYLGTSATWPGLKLCNACEAWERNKPDHDLTADSRNSERNRKKYPWPGWELPELPELPASAVKNKIFSSSESSDGSTSSTNQKQNTKPTNPLSDKEPQRAANAHIPSFEDFNEMAQLLPKLSLVDFDDDEETTSEDEPIIPNLAVTREISKPTVLSSEDEPLLGLKIKQTNVADSVKQNQDKPYLCTLNITDSSSEESKNKKRRSLPAKRPTKKRKHNEEWRHVETLLGRWEAVDNSGKTIVCDGKTSPNVAAQKEVPEPEKLLTEDLKSPSQKKSRNIIDLTQQPARFKSAEATGPAKDAGTERSTPMQSQFNIPMDSIGNIEQWMTGWHNLRTYQLQEEKKMLQEHAKERSQLVAQRNHILFLLEKKTLALEEKHKKEIEARWQRDWLWMRKRRKTEKKHGF